MNSGQMKRGAWLAKAVDDLECATVLAASGHGETALYHCQQAAEKALKAFLTWHDQPFRKTHNLLELGDACAAIDLPSWRLRLAFMF
jgi:HEPN domain-containing protein